MTSSCMVRFENYLVQLIFMTKRCVTFKNHVPRSKDVAEMISTTRRYVVCKDMSLGQRSRSQPALSAFQIQVRPITSSCIVGFENYLAEMIILTRRCVAYKNHVPRSKIKVTADTLSLGIPESCPTHNFIPKIGGI